MCLCGDVLCIQMKKWYVKIVNTGSLTRDNKFYFKAKLSTDMCIFTFKQVIKHYRNLLSSVCVCFLDASKNNFNNHDHITEDGNKR